MNLLELAELESGLFDAIRGTRHGLFCLFLIDYALILEVPQHLLGQFDLKQSLLVSLTHNLYRILIIMKYRRLFLMVLLFDGATLLIRIKAGELLALRRRSRADDPEGLFGDLAEVGRI